MPSARDRRCGPPARRREDRAGAARGRARARSARRPRSGAGRWTASTSGSIPADLALRRSCRPSRANAAYRYIARAVELAVAGRSQAICTAPLNKEALHAAGHVFPGHTELLAQLTGTTEVSMMLVAPELRVIHVHHPHRAARRGRADRARPRRAHHPARARRRCVRAGIAAPADRACAASTRTPGENGLFGRGEEETKIVPAHRGGAGRRDRRAEGPLPADTRVLPGRARRLRPGRRDVPRPGPRPGQGARPARPA